MKHIKLYKSYLHRLSQSKIKFKKYIGYGLLNSKKYVGYGLFNFKYKYLEKRIIFVC